MTTFDSSRESAIGGDIEPVIRTTVNSEIFLASMRLMSVTDASLWAQLDIRSIPPGVGGVQIMSETLPYVDENSLDVLASLQYETENHAGSLGSERASGGGGSDREGYGFWRFHVRFDIRDIWLGEYGDSFRAALSVPKLNLESQEAVSLTQLQAARKGQLALR